ncbi:cellulose binding domain-containing protein, partial [Micromonospora sp. NBS 11-29]|uniref:cellulose binding domain-containing protein n=1 Tax=Micromonospora sp. NBS 11-29 TaxID=1960879 RepID=UPI001594B0F9
MTRPSRSRWASIAAVAALTLTAAGLTGTQFASAAATGCAVTYTVSSSWPGGFGANVAVTNLGDPLTSWRLTWTFA